MYRPHDGDALRLESKGRTDVFRRGLVGVKPYITAPTKIFFHHVMLLALLCIKELAFKKRLSLTHKPRIIILPKSVI